MLNKINVYFRVVIFKFKKKNFWLIVVTEEGSTMTYEERVSCRIKSKCTSKNLNRKKDGIRIVCENGVNIRESKLQVP